MEVIVKGQPSIEIGFETKVIQVGSLGDIDSALSTESENPVMNKVITEELDKKVNNTDMATINGQSLTEGGNIEVVAEPYDDTALKEAISNKADKDGVYSGMTVGRSIDLLGVEDVEEGSFLFRATDGDGSIKDGVAVVKSVKGDSVVWNQHIKGIIESVAGLSISISDDDIISINGTATSALANFFATDYGVGGDALKNAPLGRYVLDVKIINNPDNLSVNIFAFNGRISFPNTGNYTTSYQKIGDCSSLSVGGGFGISSYGGTGTVFNNVRFKVSLYNLTQMFGAGNEPTTIEEFNARVATLCIEDMNAYNEGEVVNMKASAIKSVGFNAWDEEWENGSIGDNSGDLISSSNTIRSKNYIKAIGGNEYYFGYFGNVATWVRVHYYDAEKKWIGSIAKTLNDVSFIPPVNCAYMKFRMADGYGSTYNHDICINLVHSGYRNGEYEPYVEDVLALPTLDLFPNGMNKIGDVYDEYDSEKSVQRIGIRPYQSGDESMENVLTDGTTTLYVLEEPIVTPHDYRLAYKAWDFGTEQVIAEGNTTAMTAGIIYEFNARDTIRSNKTRLDVLEPIVAGKIDKEADDYYPQLAVGLADNLAGVDVVDSEVNFRRSGGGAISDGVARIEAIKGNSVVWNQLYSNARFENGIDNWKPYGSTTVGLDSDGSLLVTATSTSARAIYNGRYVIPANHKILTIVDFKPNNIGNGKFIFYMKGTSATETLRTFDYTETKRQIAYTIIEHDIKTYIAYYPIQNGEVGDTANVYSVVAYDLTQMFGAGNEPTTIEEFYARIPMGVDLNAYNEGEVIHMDVQSIESQGFNAWDEELENGKWSDELEQWESNPITLKSKNYIRILPNAQYRITNPSGTISRYVFYDKDKQYLSYVSAMSNSVFTTPNNAFYMMFGLGSGYKLPYNHDICINLSDTSINGKYFPYIKRTEDLSIIRKYFPQGMKSAGSAHDEIRYNKATQKWEKVVRIGEDNMWELNWGYSESSAMFYVGSPGKYFRYMGILTTEYPNVESPDVALKRIFAVTDVLRLYDPSYTDVATFKAMLQEKQVVLYYELAEPIVTELDAEDQFKDLDYQVWNCGTEKAIAEGISAPLAADITYGFNAIGKIKELESLVAALRAKVGI